MTIGMAATRGTADVIEERASRLGSLFAALDEGELTWCLLRGAATLLDGSGRDLDLLVHRNHLASFEDLVFALGGVRLPISTHPWHRFYNVPVAGSSPIRLDVVTGLIYSRDLLLASGLEDGCLERRRHDGRMWVLDATDMFWTVLLHCLLDKHEVSERRAAELVGAHDEVRRPSPGEDFFASLCPPGWSPDRALACVALRDWDALAALGRQLIADENRSAEAPGRPRASRPAGRGPRATVRRLLRPAFPAVWRGAGLGVIPSVVDTLEAAGTEALVLSLVRRPGWCDVTLLVADDERRTVEALLQESRYLPARGAWARVTGRGVERVRVVRPWQLGLSAGDLEDLRSRSLPVAGRTRCRRVPESALAEVRASAPGRPPTRRRRARAQVTVSFSGLDGAGKSSQIDALRARLDGRHTVDAIWLPFKFWPPAAKHWVPTRVRRLVRPTDVADPDKGIAPSQEDRNAHLEQARPATARGERTPGSRTSLRATLRSFAATGAAFSTALSLRSRASGSGADVLVLDRYRLDSAMKLQYAFPRVSATRLARIVELVAPRPDLEVFCRVPPEVAYARKAEQWTLEELTIQARLYDRLTARWPTVLVVDATRDRNDVAEEIWQHMRKLIDGR